MLDNFEHIKAYWIMLTPSIAQSPCASAQRSSDGTVVEEKIYHDAGAKTSEFTPRTNSNASSAPRPRSVEPRHALQQN